MSGPARLTPRMAIPTDDLGPAPRIDPPAQPKRLSRLDERGARLFSGPERVPINEEGTATATAAILHARWHEEIGVLYERCPWNAGSFSHFLSRDRPAAR